MSSSLADRHRRHQPAARVEPGAATTASSSSWSGSASAMMPSVLEPERRDEEKHRLNGGGGTSPPQLAETNTESTEAAEDWLLDELDQMSVRTQTLEEIMAEKNTDFEFPDNDDELLYLLNDGGGGGGAVSSAGGDGASGALPAGNGADTPSSLALTTAGPPIVPMGRYGATATELPNAYQLDSPLLIQRADAISHQIASVHERPPSGGRPTVLCVGRQLIAVGTARGLCLLFERGTQRLRRFIQAEKAFGSISCLDFSLDSQQQRICAGFSSGALTVFDCARGRVLFSGDDLIQPGRAVLHVKYISNFALLIVDSGGNVYEFHERQQQHQGKVKGRKRGGGGVRCLFAGCKGEVTNICFVHTDDVELLVLATFHQVLLLSTKRRGAPVGQLRLHGSPLHPPVIDWRERRIGMISGGHSANATAAASSLRVGGDLLFPLTGVVFTEQPLLNLKWLDNWALLAVIGEAGSEQLQLMELHHEQQKKGGQQRVLGASITASTDIGSTVQLLYNSADFKGLATGQYVSEAMSKLADSVCLHSVSRHDGDVDEQLHLLGRNGVFGVQLMDQAEQLQALVERHDFASALLYAVDVCNGRVRDRSRLGNFRAQASHEVPRLVTQLLDQTIDGLDSGRIDDLVVHYKRNIYVLIRACISTSHFELLYGTVYDQLQKDSLCRPIFLELLEEFVLERQLDRPPPGLVNDYLAYLLAEGQLPQFEQSVTRLPVECMDLHQVMTTCLHNQLFDGLCHVMNNAMRDYIGPLKEMCEHMHHSVRKEVLSDCDIAQGNKLLLYLSCCLAGRAYPYGELPDEHVAKTVPLETYKFLVQLRPKFVAGPPSSAGSTPSPTTSKEVDDVDADATLEDAANCIASGNNLIRGNAVIANRHRSAVAVAGGCVRRSAVADLRFPHLQLLLKLDPQQFLNVLNTCADAPVFANVEGRLKRLVDVLIAKCVEDEDERNELGPLLIAFVVGLLQKGSIPKDVFIFTQLIKRVLQRQFMNVRAQKQAELHIVDFLRVVPEIDMDIVLDVAQKQPHIHICAYIFTLRKQYVQLLECCLGDAVDPKNVFHILADLLTNLREPGQLLELREFVRAQLGRLSTLDPQLTAHLVMAHLPEILAEARSNPRKLPFQLVRHCFVLRRQQGHRTLSGDDEEQDELFFDYLFEDIIDEARALAESEKSDEATAALDNELSDLLRYWLPLGAVTDHCLNVAMQQQRPNDLLATISLLLVARGHIQRAFELIFLEGIERRDRQPPEERCIASLLELAAAHPAEAQHGDWLAKLFRHLLKALPEATSIDASTVIEQQLIRPKTHLSRVLTAIIEQQQHQHDDISESGKEKCSPASVIVAELFNHSLFRHAPLHAFHRLVRQMLLWCEIRVLMERATCACARHELAEQFGRNLLGLGTRPAFAVHPENAKSCCSTTTPYASLSSFSAQDCCRPIAGPATPAAGHCLWCQRRIVKSFYLFPCGHTLHLECVEEQHQKPSSSSPTVAETGAKTKRRHRCCPCSSSSAPLNWANNASTKLLKGEQHQHNNNSRGGGDEAVVDEESMASLPASCDGAASNKKLANKPTTTAALLTGAGNGRSSNNEMDERRAASAVLRRLEHEFPLCTGPPPPAKTANNAFHRFSLL
uniref:Vacuolar protein sorting-associated protein 8 central domain-containing protein n=1 Tax=Globodera rostochiensis TaxID=31243 RepID=A0A914H7N1_GLORO